MGSPPWVSSRSPDRPEREDLLGRDFLGDDFLGGNFAGISMNFGWMFFSDFFRCFLCDFWDELWMIYDDLWWFISSYKITICDFGDDFWDDFSLQKMFGISLTMCWNHRHPRFSGFCYGLYRTRSTLQKFRQFMIMQYFGPLCEAVPTGWFEGNWEAPTSISKPRLKPPGRPATTWKRTGKTNAALKSYEVTRCEDPWKTGQKPKQICSLYMWFEESGASPKKCMASSSNLGLQLRHNELGLSSKITCHLVKHI